LHQPKWKRRREYTGRMKEERAGQMAKRKTENRRSEE
jgi:hypothetical protein